MAADHSQRCSTCCWRVAFKTNVVNDDARSIGVRENVNGARRSKEELASLVKGTSRNKIEPSERVLLVSVLHTLFTTSYQTFVDY
eukprot:1375043-Amorphochlora_amoeboformis.AAC.1